MRYSIAIAGEPWEAPFASATAASIARWAAPETAVWAPSEFADALRGTACGATFVPPRDDGFQTYSAVRARVVDAANAPVLILAAGTTAARAVPVERLGARSCDERRLEWIAAGDGPTILHFHPPPHQPPAAPAHSVRREGLLDVWEVRGARSYYAGLLSLDVGTLPPVFSSYGQGRPLFVYNTNRFDEPAVPPHQQYVILGSGLLGLRLVLESDPPPGARVIVYDINSGQLAWIRFLLANAGAAAELEDVVRSFSAACPGVGVRPVEPHERENAAAQAAWYRRHHERLAVLSHQVQWDFVVCDLLTAPRSLLDRIDPAMSTMFMYLDLFLIWRIDAERPRVEHHVDLAESLEELVRGAIRGSVTFVPGAASCRFQLPPDSPFYGSRS